MERKVFGVRGERAKKVSEAGYVPHASPLVAVEFGHLLGVSRLVERRDLAEHAVDLLGLVLWLGGGGGGVRAGAAELGRGRGVHRVGRRGAHVRGIAAVVKVMFARHVVVSLRAVGTGVGRRRRGVVDGILRHGHAAGRRPRACARLDRVGVSSIRHLCLRLHRRPCGAGRSVEGMRWCGHAHLGGVERAADAKVRGPRCVGGHCTWCAVTKGIHATG